MAATAFVVIAVALAVGQFGPLVGGALAGLPIVLGPGFYFLIAKAQPEFVAHAAAYSILSLCATQVFLLVYIAAARRASPLWSCVAATAAWMISVVLLRFLPINAWLGLAVFIGVTLATHRIGARFLRAAVKRRRAESLGLLLLRGGLAGLLVATVTMASGHLGVEWSGLLMAYPIGYTVLSVTIHEQFGSDTVMATLHSAIMGTVSLGAYCAALALVTPILPYYGAFVVALAVSLIVTVGLVLRSRLRLRAA